MMSHKIPSRKYWKGCQRELCNVHAAARSEAPTTSGGTIPSNESDTGVQNPAIDATSNDGRNVSEAGFNPWASGAAPAKQMRGKGAENQKKAPPRRL